MLSFAHPTRFLQITARAIPVLAILTSIATVVGLYAAWFIAPADYQQGETIRILFIHVPTATLSLGIYAFMASAAIGSLVWRHPLADIAQQVAAPIGAVYALICLVTGALWGKPMWGTYWVWDARLTSMLLLFLIYTAVIALWNAVENRPTGARAVAIFTLVGVINLPIIKFSVEWWNTLHQPASLLRFENGGLAAPSLHSSMLYPLLLMMLAFGLLALTLLILGMRTRILAQRQRAQQRRQQMSFS
jgi:heme exporter protein C